MKTAIVAFGLAGLVALAACHGQPTAGGLTADQERQLDNAAAMLDDNMIFDAAPDSLAANATDVATPADATGPAAANRTGNTQ